MFATSSPRSPVCTLLVLAVIGSLLTPMVLPGNAAPGPTYSPGIGARKALPNRINLKSQNSDRGGFRSGELLIRFRLTTPKDQQTSLATTIGAKELRPLRGKSRVMRLILSAGQIFEAVALTLKNNPAVEYVEPNFLIYQDGVEPQTVQRSAVTPNDPMFAEQWGLVNVGGSERLFGSDIKVAKLWKHTVGSKAVRVAVIDSGIDFTHPDLKNQQWTNEKESVDSKDSDRNGFVDDLNGWDFVNDSASGRDPGGHGTNVAGIIAAEGNNEFGIAGVMWQSSLMNLRVLDGNGVGDTASAIEAIDYAADQGAHVINLSWGTDEKSLFLKDTIRRAARYGAVVVCSAGNGGRDLATTPYYPAAFDLPHQISVSASDGSDNSLSNYGRLVPTVAAPGAAIVTTRATVKRTGKSPGAWFETVSGTSAAAAFVSGVAGLFKSLSLTMKPDEIKQALIMGARRSANLSEKNQAGGVVSGLGGLSAANNRGEDEDESEGSNGGEAGAANQPKNVLRGGDAKGSSEKNKRITRRRRSLGPGLPNLDTQKNVRPVLPKMRTPTPSTQRNCSPSEPDCKIEKQLTVPRRRASLTGHCYYKQPMAVG